ncbi:MAG: CAP domain-containing protein [Actinomycetota bacterium]
MKMRLCAVMSTLAAAFVVVLMTAAPAQAGPQDDDWQAIVNTYRELSGLGPVGANAQWSAEARDHSCTMVRNGVITHEGSAAGENGNVAVSSDPNQTARDFLDLWMTGPFHAIGLLRPGLTQTGYGQCSDPGASRWRSGATIDVLRGDNGATTNQPIVFPGNGARIPLDRFIAESPDPAAMCGYGSTAGVPLFAMMPDDFSSVSASLRGPGGDLPTCVLHAGNTSGVAQSILDGDHAVIVMTPRHLAEGVHTATVTTDTGSVTWSFQVDLDAELGDRIPPLVLPNTEAVSSEPGGLRPVEPTRIADSRRSLGLQRLAGGQTTRFRVSDDNAVVAVAANFTVARANGVGYLTAYDCGSSVPTTATVNYGSSAVQNLGVIPVRRGEICLFSSVSADLIIDVTGFVRLPEGDNIDGTAGLRTFNPARIVDTRSDGSGRFDAGETRRIRVAGQGGVDRNATAAAVTITSVNTAAQSYITMWDCSTSTPPETSAGNVTRGETRANAAMVQLSPSGDVCVYSDAAAHILIDVSGDFLVGRGLELTPLVPIRLMDTRSYDTRLSAGTNGGQLATGAVTRLSVAGERGIPSNARAVTLNLSSIRPSASVYITAYPCQSSPPLVSSLNHAPGGVPVVANSVTVALDSKGDLCIFSSAPTHLTVDITGSWS